MRLLFVPTHLSPDRSLFPGCRNSLLTRSGSDSRCSDRLLSLSLRSVHVRRAPEAPPRIGDAKVHCRHRRRRVPVLAHTSKLVECRAGRWRRRRRRRRRRGPRCTGRGRRCAVEAYGETGIRRRGWVWWKFGKDGVDDGGFGERGGRVWS